MNEEVRSKIIKESQVALERGADEDDVFRLNELALSSLRFGMNPSNVRRKTIKELKLLYN